MLPCCTRLWLDLWRPLARSNSTRQGRGLIPFADQKSPLHGWNQAYCLCCGSLFLHERGYTLQRPFLKDETIRFCVELAEEGQRLAEGERVAAQTIR